MDQKNPANSRAIAVTTRSHGGFTTKIRLRCNAVGLPIGAELTAGEAHDVTAYDELMNQRDTDPHAMFSGRHTAWCARQGAVMRVQLGDYPHRDNAQIQNRCCPDLVRLFRLSEVG